MLEETTVVSKILDVMKQSQRDLSVTEIAKLAGTNRVTTHYAVKTLVELGKLQQTRKVGHIPLYELANEVV